MYCSKNTAVNSFRIAPIVLKAFLLFSPLLITKETFQSCNGIVKHTLQNITFIKQEYLFLNLQGNRATGRTRKHGVTFRGPLQGSFTPLVHGDPCIRTRGSCHTPPSMSFMYKEVNSCSLLLLTASLSAGLQ